MINTILQFVKTNKQKNNNNKNHTQNPHNIYNKEKHNEMRYACASLKNKKKQASITFILSPSMCYTRFFL